LKASLEADKQERVGRPEVNFRSFLLFYRSTE
jgi:hypothetical protein